MIDKKTYLFIFSIGPVQSFIAQARKTQDLYAGSALLSALVKKVIEKVGKDKIVYPYPENESLTNRIVATFYAENDEHLVNSINKIKSDIEDDFMDLAEKHLGRFSNWSYAKKQLIGFLDIHWAAIEYDENNYQNCYEQLELQYSATKNYRPFIQLCEQGRKCNVTGQYNALYYRRATNDSKNDKILRGKKFLTENCIILNENDNQYIKYKDLQAGEGICAITMLKRKFQQKHNDFASTADVAMLHSLTQILASENYNLKNEVTCLSILLGEKWPYFIGQFWFEENMNKDYYIKQGKEAIFEQTKQKSEIINKYLKEEKIKIQKYYAVLTFDADNMGKTIGSLSEAEQRNLSQALGKFADEMKDIVDKQSYGYSVYAGGDDYLGFLTLPTLYKALGEIRTKFDDFVGKEFNLTMSAGVAIAHYKTPLAETIAWSRRMEHEAKDATDKNAIGIAAVKKSGEIIKTVLKWENNNVQIVNLLNRVYDALNINFSSKFIHVIHHEFESLLSSRIAGKEKAQILSEVRRLLDRACEEQGNKEKKKKLINSFYKDLEQLMTALSNKDVLDFIQTMSIIDFSTRKIEV